MGDPRELSERQSLDKLAANSTEGAGFVTACVGAAAADLATMVARSSPDWTEAGALTAQSETLRERLLRLAPANAEAYAAARDALDVPRSHDDAVGRSLERAAALPLEIADASASVAELAAVLAERGNPALRGDAVAAALLAEGAARAAAHLVGINLGITADDERVRRASRVADDAAAAAARALAAAV